MKGNFQFFNKTIVSQESKTFILFSQVIKCNSFKVEKNNSRRLFPSSFFTLNWKNVYFKPQVKSNRINISNYTFNIYIGIERGREGKQEREGKQKKKGKQREEKKERKEKKEREGNREERGNREEETGDWGRGETTRSSQFFQFSIICSL